MKKLVLTITLVLVSIITFSQTTYVDKIKTVASYKTAVFDNYDFETEEFTIDKVINFPFNLQASIEYNKETKYLDLKIYNFDIEKGEYVPFNKQEMHNVLVTIDKKDNDYVYIFVVMDVANNRLVPIYMIKTSDKLDKSLVNIKEFYHIKFDY